MGNKYTKITVDEYGTKVWKVNNRLHRGWDRPAIENADGTYEWWVNGERHRGWGRPAVVHADGSCEWWVNGKRHRGKGRPAIVDDDYSCWCVNGKVHRTGDKPAKVWRDGSKEWWENDVLHRDGGPAIVFPEGKEHAILIFPEWNNKLSVIKSYDGPFKCWYTRGVKIAEGPATIRELGCAPRPARGPPNFD